MTSPSYWRLDFYEQVATVLIDSSSAKIVLTIEEESTAASGGIEEIASQMSLDPRLIIEVDRQQLSIKTRGIPFIVDSPSRGVKIDIKIEEDFELIFAPPCSRHKIVHAYHQELIKAMEGESLYPFSADWHLYPDYEKYYKAIFDVLGISGCDSEALPQADRIHYKSRHEFLIASKPVLRPKTEQWVAGISGLAQLMGFSIPEEVEEVVETSSPSIDPILSTVVGALLMFKGRAGWVIDNYSLVEMSSILREASDRIRAANEDMDRKMGKGSSTPIVQPETKPEAEHEEWTKAKGDAIKKLTKLNVPMPECDRNPRF